jgi:hypothetical protein
VTSLLAKGFGIGAFCNSLKVSWWAVQWPIVLPEPRNMRLRLHLLDCYSCLAAR